MNTRKVEEQFFKTLMIIATLIIISTLGVILLTVIMKGLPALSLSMITQTPKGGYYLGKEGGILNAIIGSLYLAGGATVLAILISLPIVMYFNIYAPKKSLFVSACRFSLDVLWGVPSIVFGAFGFTIMLFFGLRASLLGGIIAVALLVLPVMSRAMDEVVKMIPRDLLEASFSLGATRLQTAAKVVVRQALPGILTAVLVAFGRGIGDAASVIFTAGFTDSIPTSILRPAATLPLAIFFQLGTPFPEVQDRAYASALVLTAVILIISILSRVLAKSFTKHVVK
ncbi:MAG: phosphate ABC transporter permease PstA [Fidelibacterota bacterium]|nr:MAG: phosphate ABC transporter permease PstA [Candidatus Neomarinimicrobiota bacterium]